MVIKFFPAEEYQLKYRKSKDGAIDFFRENTKESNVLATVITGKRFIGIVNNEIFKVISSEVGIGAFCVFSGVLVNDGCNLKVEINKPFKILLCIISLMMPLAIVIQLIVSPGWQNIGLIVPLSMFIVIGRFILKFMFKQSLNLGFSKLNSIFVLES